MPLKRFYILVLMTFLALVSGCKKENDDVLPDQRKRIVSFLTSSHSPRLVKEEELEPDGKQPFYTELAHGNLYRYIDNYYNPDRKNWAEVLPTSKVTITFRCYQFDFSAITDRDIPYFTNDPLWEKTFYEELGLTPGVWDFTPLEINLPHTNVIRGLKESLVGCRVGDDVEIYMTYGMAYGEDDFSILPKQSPIAIMYTVNSVE